VKPGVDRQRTLSGAFQPEALIWGVANFSEMTATAKVIPTGKTPGRKRVPPEEDDPEEELPEEPDEELPEELEEELLEVPATQVP